MFMSLKLCLDSLYFKLASSGLPIFLDYEFGRQQIVLIDYLDSVSFVPALLTAALFSHVFCLTNQQETKGLYTALWYLICVFKRNGTLVLIATVPTVKNVYFNFFVCYEKRYVVWHLEIQKGRNWQLITEPGNSQMGFVR